MVDRARQLEEMVDTAMELKRNNPDYQRIMKSMDEIREFEKMMEIIKPYVRKGSVEMLSRIGEHKK